MKTQLVASLVITLFASAAFAVEALPQPELLPQPMWTQSAGSPVLTPIVGGPACCREIKLCTPRYVDHGGRVCCRPCEKVEALLHIADPRNPACCIAVPVCIPACCLECPPRCRDRRGLFVGGVVRYEWPCGYEVRVVFLKRGGVVVHYFGV